MEPKVKIEVSKEVRDKIAKTFGVTGVMVSYALTYNKSRGNSDLAKKIRKMAMENGGRRMAYWPECETIHNEVNGTMIQIFDNGAVLTIDKHTGDARVEYKGKTMLEKEDISVREIYIMQEYAAAF
jgi:hypothetical protein